MLSKRNCFLTLAVAMILAMWLAAVRIDSSRVKEQVNVATTLETCCLQDPVRRIPAPIEDGLLSPVVFEDALDGPSNDETFVARVDAEEILEGWTPLPKKDSITAGATIDLVAKPIELDENSNHSILDTEAPETGIRRTPAGQFHPVTVLKPVGPTRTAISEAAAHKAVYHIEYGKTLSRRGASFAAQQEFLRALSLVAQAIDSQGPESGHSRALDNAVVAIGEAKDFFVGQSENQIGLNIAGVLETHRSRIVSEEEAGTLTPVSVIQRYFSHAEEQLVVASGHNPIGAEALFCLGKLYYVMSKHSLNSDRLDVAKSIMFHRAALACDSENFRSANELGALLASNGSMKEAKTMLQKSLVIEPTPQAWGNLAIIHERLGEEQLAQLAKSEYVQTLQKPTGAAIPNTIQWVSPQTFNDGAVKDYHESTARLPNLSTSNANPDGPGRMSDSSSWFEKLKKLF